MKIVAEGNGSSLTVSIQCNCDCTFGKPISKDGILDWISSMEDYISDVRKAGDCTSKYKEIEGCSDTMEDIIKEFKQENRLKASEE